MRKLFLILLLPSLSFAGGPKSTFPEPRGLDAEFQSVYHDIANPVINYGSASSFTVTNFTVSTMTVSSFTSTNGTIGISSTNSCGYLIGTTVQVQSFSISSTSSTTKNVFIPTATKVSIIPKCVSDLIYVFATGDLSCQAASSLNTFASLFRGTTNLFGSNGGALMRNDATGQTLHIAPIVMQYLDSPQSVSSLTYTVYIKNSDNASTIDFPDGIGSGVTGVITAIEIAK